MSTHHDNLSDRQGPPTAAAKVAFAQRITVAAETRRKWGAKWRTLPKALRSVIALAGIVLLYLLPVIKPPIITTPDTDFPSLLAGSVVIFVIVAMRLQRHLP